MRVGRIYSFLHFGINESFLIAKRHRYGYEKNACSKIRVDMELQRCRERRDAPATVSPSLFLSRNYLGVLTRRWNETVTGIYITKKGKKARKKKKGRVVATGFAARLFPVPKPPTFLRIYFSLCPEGENGEHIAIVFSFSPKFVQHRFLPLLQK